ncbi:MAG: 30S ribosomal protein S17 [Parcubacteria group bacterium GW2011_GWA2_38_13]|nr:MAG: 30S ribosomal protein S17 [Parcubacteria group bacterium GW2011_GWA2_38_13]
MANEQKKKLSARIFKGIVKSSKMDKTLVVEVQRSKKDPKYGKYFKAFKRFKVHNPENKHKEGDVVSFIECRPISREKRWIVL